eukprot:TRINITY_DN3402_c0_g1_i1.p1 TRINITY_DN3402_c0_g1~~TRINITY_DN3402_c0_g1_i1.p1  ORF type:complete len:241 (-),score=33.52 TRINITY_DN3402_c0_g1_i1:99-821(-)
MTEICLNSTQKKSNSPSPRQTKKVNSSDPLRSPKTLKKNKLSGVATYDPTNTLVKHPLQNQWTWWYDNPGKKSSQSSWGAHLKKIITFDTVEDFWRLYNNIVPPSQLISGSDYHLFKHGVEPKWEDPRNVKGGKWIYNIQNKNGRDHIDKLWLWTILSCIGEGFLDTYNEEICGCVVSVRKNQDRITLWTRSLNESAVVSIGKSFKKALELNDCVVLGFQAHSDCQKSNSSFNNKNKYEA